MAASVSAARAQSGFIQDSPSPASAPAAASSTSTSTDTQAATAPAAVQIPKPALAGFPGLILPGTLIGGLPITPEMEQQSVNGSVAVLTSRLYLNSYQQSQITSILSYNLREIAAVCSNTQSDPTVAANEASDLYQKTLDEVNGVLTADQKTELQTMMAGGAGALPPSTTPGLGIIPQPIVNPSAPSQGGMPTSSAAIQQAQAQQVTSTVTFMTSQLGLNSFQQNQLKAILTASGTQMQELANTEAGNPSLLAQQSNKVSQTTLNQINQILTPSQKTIFNNMMNVQNGPPPAVSNTPTKSG